VVFSEFDWDNVAHSLDEKLLRQARQLRHQIQDEVSEVTSKVGQFKHPVVEATAMQTALNLLFDSRQAEALTLYAVLGSKPSAALAQKRLANGLDIRPEDLVNIEHFCQNLARVDQAERPRRKKLEEDFSLDQLALAKLSIKEKMQRLGVSLFEVLAATPDATQVSAECPCVSESQFAAFLAVLNCDLSLRQREKLREFASRPEGIDILRLIEEIDPRCDRLSVAFSRLAHGVFIKDLVLKNMFQYLDVFHDDALSYPEMAAGLENLALALSSLEIESLILAVDSDHNGEVTKEEFV